MKTLQKPVTEREILKAVLPTAGSPDVLNSLRVKAECCVDHLCGCQAPPPADEMSGLQPTDTRRSLS